MYRRMNCALGLIFFAGGLCEAILPIQGRCSWKAMPAR